MHEQADEKENGQQDVFMRLDKEKRHNRYSEPHDEMVILGRVSGVYGVKGWIKIYSYTDPAEAIVNYSTWYMRPGNRRSDWAQVELLQGKGHAKTVIARLQGCDDRNLAQLYTGYEIAINSSQLKQLNGIDEFYWRDLIGLKVVNRQGVVLGKVKHLLETGANDVLVVRSDSTNGEHQEHLIPWSFEQVIISVNLEVSLIEVDWQEDWIK